MPALSGVASHALTMLANRRAACTEFDLLESLGACPAALPKTLRSQPARLNRALPTIGDWIYEARLDGYRVRMFRGSPLIGNRTRRSCRGRVSAQKADQHGE